MDYYYKNLIDGRTKPPDVDGPLLAYPKKEIKRSGENNENF